LSTRGIISFFEADRVLVLINSKEKINILNLLCDSVGILHVGGNKKFFLKKLQGKP